MANYLDQFRDPSSRLFVLRVDLAAGALYLDRYTDAFPEVLEDTVTIETSGVTHVRGQGLKGGRLLVTFTQGTDVKCRISEDGGDTWGTALTVVGSADGSDAWFGEDVGLLVVMTHHTVPPFGPHRWDYWVLELDSAGALAVAGGPFANLSTSPNVLPNVGRLFRSPNGIWWFMYKTDPSGSTAIRRCRGLNESGGAWSFEMTIESAAAADQVDAWFAEDLGLLIVASHFDNSLGGTPQWRYYTAGENSAGTLALVAGSFQLVVCDDPHGRLMRDPNGVWRFIYTDNLGAVTFLRCRDLDPATGGTWS